MKRVPVECITKISPAGELTPIRIRFYDQEEAVVLHIDKILVKDKKTLFATMNAPRSTEYSYKCETVVAGYRKPLTLTFNQYSCKWTMLIE